MEVAAWTGYAAQVDVAHVLRATVGVTVAAAVAAHRHHVQVIVYHPHAVHRLTAVLLAVAPAHQKLKNG